jgi:hypothetical protein
MHIEQFFKSVVTLTVLAGRCVAVMHIEEIFKCRDLKPRSKQQLFARHFHLTVCAFKNTVF